MAVVPLCGLTSSTVLNMLVLPTMYARFGVQRVHPELGESSQEHDTSELEGPLVASR